MTTWVDPDKVRREARRVRGNRVWRVETPQGPIILKAYRRKSWWGPVVLRSLTARIVHGATGVGLAARRGTEKDMLARWKAAGIDVPADLSAGHPRLAASDVLVMEAIDGGVVGWLLGGRNKATREERDAVLHRVGEAWGRRLRLALEREDRTLVQVHGSFMHFMVTDDRVVMLDFEQAYLPGGEVGAAVSREVAMCLRFLAKQGDAATFNADLDALVSGFGDPAPLAMAVDEYLRSPRPLRRLLWGLDRRLRRSRKGHRDKYAVMALLEEALRRRGGTQQAAPDRKASVTAPAEA